MCRVFMFCCLLLSLTTAEAFAHDYWLEPSPWSVAHGDSCAVGLLVGGELESELERPLQTDMTTRFDLFTRSGVTPLLKDTPAGTLPVFHRPMTESGPSLFVMDRSFVPIETTVGDFLEFLDHEGQPELGAEYDGVAAVTPLLRRYARSIKALIYVDPPAMERGAHATELQSNLHDAKVGQTIEIRLLQSPEALALGDTLGVHVQFQSADLGNQVIKAMVRQPDGAVAEQSTRTDTSGMARFAIDRAGLWVIRVAHLRRCHDCDADWDTYYATYTFIQG